MKIFKYKVNLSEMKDNASISIALPIGADVLAFQVQHGMPCIWVAVNPIIRGMKIRTFYVAGTGHHIADYDKMKYYGTIQLLDGDLVFHLFENMGAEREANIDPGEIEA